MNEYFYQAYSENNRCFDKFLTPIVCGNLIRDFVDNSPNADDQTEEQKTSKFLAIAYRYLVQNHRSAFTKMRNKYLAGLAHNRITYIKLEKGDILYQYYKHAIGISTGYFRKYLNDNELEELYLHNKKELDSLPTNAADNMFVEILYKCLITDHYEDFLYDFYEWASTPTKVQIGIESELLSKNNILKEKISAIRNILDH
jgi:hypothetical protein